MSISCEDDYYNSSVFLFIYIYIYILNIKIEKNLFFGVTMNLFQVYDDPN